MEVEMTRFLVAIGSVLAIIILGCEPKPVISPPPTQDTFGCVAPPPSVFTQAGVDITWAKSNFGKVVIGDLSIKTDPKVITLVSQAASDFQITSYLECLARNRDHYNNDQIAYLHMFNAFVSTKPTADQLATWQKDHPYPK
jgi:hypothetical protein